MVAFLHVVFLTTEKYNWWETTEKWICLVWGKAMQCLYWRRERGSWWEWNKKGCWNNIQGWRRKIGKLKSQKSGTGKCCCNFWFLVGKTSLSCFYIVSSLFTVKWHLLLLIFVFIFYPYYKIPVRKHFYKTL